MKEQVVQLECSICGHPNLLLGVHPIEIPYFGEATECRIRCPGCGHRSGDIIFHQIGEPRRWELEVKDPRDLRVRVVRGQSGTVRIPEQGLEVFPSVRSEAYVTNVEGILVRFEDILKGVRSRSEKTEEEGRRTEELLVWLARARDGLETFTLIIEDPLGQSGILTSRARTILLTKEEVADLPYGMLVVDIDHDGGVSDGS